MSINAGKSATVSPPPLGSTVIPVVNKLRDILSKVGGEVDSELELPQVAVVGSQSSGKSSVLEALVGRDFLPRGSDICTRRPLLLQLVRTDEGDEYGEFRHLPGRKFFDFSQIRAEIQAETQKEAGGNKGISTKQICLKIFSQNVLDMTLVDLPGMTKVPVGDQPLDIEARIRTMILSYIRHPRCLILAITPANSDLANSDALHIAGIADPDGNRTIGVVTKLDIMDRGTDARNLLLGKAIPLRLGYVGIINRSQEDIDLNRSIQDALASEEAFFHSHPAYNGLADRCGIPQLAKQLNQIFMKHIYKVLPDLKSCIRSKLVSVTKEHSTCGYMPRKADQGALVLDILLKYSEDFASLVDGRNEAKLTSEVYGGARIQYIFQSIFVKHLEEVDPFEGLTDEDIRTAILNATGPRSALFVPEVPFQVLIRRQIVRLLDPSLQCARLVYNELRKMSHCCLVHELQRFPLLRTRINEIVENFLLEGVEPSETMIRHIIEMEVDYINTSHPNFIGGNKAVEVAARQIRSYTSSTSTSIPRDGVDFDVTAVSGSSPKSKAIVVRSHGNGIVTDQGVRSVADIESNASSGIGAGTNWRISSFFRGRESLNPSRDISRSNSNHETPTRKEHASIIQLREPPTRLSSSEMHSENEVQAFAVTKQLLESYYAIVRKKIEDAVPKAIMHFLVINTKKELCNVLIGNLYRESLFERLLQETEEVSVKRIHVEETLQALKEASKLLDELQIEGVTIERGS